MACNTDFQPITVLSCQCASLSQVLIHHGLFPTAPSQPRVAVSVELLSFYRALFERSCDAVNALAHALNTHYSRRGFRFTNKDVKSIPLIVYPPLTFVQGSSVLEPFRYQLMSAQRICVPVNCPSLWGPPRNLTRSIPSAKGCSRTVHWIEKGCRGHTIAQQPASRRKRRLQRRLHLRLMSSRSPTHPTTLTRGLNSSHKTYIEPRLRPTLREIKRYPQHLSRSEHCLCASGVVLEWCMNLRMPSTQWQISVHLQVPSSTQKNLAGIATVARSTRTQWTPRRRRRRRREHPTRRLMPHRVLESARPKGRSHRAR